MITFESQEFNDTNLARMDLPYLIAANLVLTVPNIKDNEGSVWDSFTKPSTTPTGPDDMVVQFTNMFIERLLPYASNIGWSPRGHVIYRQFFHKGMVCIQAVLFISVGEGVDEGTVVRDDRTVMGVMFDTWREVSEHGDLHIGAIESYPHHNREETGQPCAIPDQRSFLIKNNWEWEEGELTCVDYSNDIIAWYYY